VPSKWLKCFTQQWEGDVTIVLPHTFLQLYKAVVNPSNAGGQVFCCCFVGSVPLWSGRECARQDATRAAHRPIGEPARSAASLHLLP
jgi:uncharacterized membrane protein